MWTNKHHTKLGLRWCAAIACLAACTQSAGAAVDCRQVYLQPIRHLSLGVVSIGPKKRGWLLLDPSGGYSTAGDVAIVGKQLPSPGLVRLSAPPNTVVYLRAFVQTSGGAQDAGLSQVTLAHQHTLLEKNVQDWTIHIPNTAARNAMVDVDIQVGARFAFSSTAVVVKKTYRVSLECVGVHRR